MCFTTEDEWRQELWKFKKDTAFSNATIAGGVGVSATTIDLFLKGRRGSSATLKKIKIFLRSQEKDEKYGEYTGNKVEE